jgi:hypothetical protein
MKDADDNRCGRELKSLGPAVILLEILNHYAGTVRDNH